MGKQQPYPGDELVRQLDDIMAIYDRARTQVLADEGIRQDRMYALRRAASPGGVPMSDLQKDTGLPPYQVSRTVSWLVNNRLATRSPGRSRTVSATAFGRKKVGAVDEKIKAELMKLLPGPHGRSGRVARVLAYLEGINRELYQRSLLDEIEP